MILSRSGVLNAFPPEVEFIKSRSIFVLGGKIRVQITTKLALSFMFSFHLWRNQTVLKKSQKPQTMD
jgi:hypothetical protein